LLSFSFFLLISKFFLISPLFSPNSSFCLPLFYLLFPYTSLPAFNGFILSPGPFISSTFLFIVSFYFPSFLLLLSLFALFTNFFFFQVPDDFLQLSIEEITEKKIRRVAKQCRTSIGRILLEYATMDVDRAVKLLALWEDLKSCDNLKNFWFIVIELRCVLRRLGRLRERPANRPDPFQENFLERGILQQLSTQRNHLTFFLQQPKISKASGSENQLAEKAPVRQPAHNNQAAQPPTDSLLKAPPSGSVAPPTGELQVSIKIIFLYSKFIIDS